ncbi:MAG: SH3 domain-containing protein [Pseudomonadota bacterium]
MKTRIAACAGMLLVVAGAGAADTAYIVRPTELKAKPFSDAATLATLAQSSQVNVLERQASWLQVKTPGATGWVKLLSVRYDQVTASSRSSGVNSNLEVLFNISRTGSSGTSVATTGVNGINEEALRNPRPNPAALQQMQALDTSAADARSFAKAGHLNSATLAYVAPVGEKP